MLLSLPDEVLLLVLRHLSLWTHADVEIVKWSLGPRMLDNWQALARVCRTCTRLRAIAEPLLYRTYVKPPNALKPDRLGPEIIENSNLRLHRANRHLRCFLRTLIERPDLARLVRFMTLGEWDTAWSLRKAGAFTELPDQDLVHSYRLATKEIWLRKPWAVKWVSYLACGIEDAEVALLLSLTTNLTELDIALPNFYEKRGHELFYRRIFEDALGEDAGGHSQTAFKQLRRIHTVLWQPTNPPAYGFPLYPVSEMIRLPSLESFAAYGAFESGYAFQWTVKPRTLPLTSLDLGGCGLSASALATLIASCACLKTLFLSYGEDTAQTEDITWPEIITALESQKDSLEVLGLRADPCSQLYAEEISSQSGLKEFADWKPVGSLRHFTALKKLSIYQTPLLGPEDYIGEIEPALTDVHLPDILPSSLESLVIANCTIFALPQLEALLCVGKRGFPHLKKIDVEPVDLWLDLLDVTETEADQVSSRLERIKKGFRNAQVDWVEDVVP
ncbi:hypothetical protein MBLNU459_g1125t1 [Dothideomycetes sp. NU459]